MEDTNMEIPLFRKEVLFHQYKNKSEEVKLKKVAPIYLLFGILLITLIFGTFVSLTNSHVYKEKFAVFIAPTQSNLTLPGSSNFSVLDAYIFVPEEVLKFVVVGQMVKLNLAGSRYETLLPLESKITSIISPDDPISDNESAGQSSNRMFVAVAPLPVEAVFLDGIRHELVPGMPMQVNMYTEQVTWLELFLQPLKKLRNL